MVTQIWLKNRQSLNKLIKVVFLYHWQLYSVNPTLASGVVLSCDLESFNLYGLSCRLAPFTACGFSQQTFNYSCIWSTPGSNSWGHWVTRSPSHQSIFSFTFTETFCRHPNSAPHCLTSKALLWNLVEASRPPSFMHSVCPKSQHHMNGAVFCSQLGLTWVTVVCLDSWVQGNKAWETTSQEAPSKLDTCCFEEIRHFQD